MEKEFKIKVPDGYEIDKENSTFELIKFKPIEKKLPKTWEEYCEIHDVQIEECWVEYNSSVSKVPGTGVRDSKNDRNLLPNVLYSKAMIALCQLIQLRDYYNGDWVPNWEDLSYKYCIEISCNIITGTTNAGFKKVLAFKTKELRNDFIKNFKDLIEIAKPLL